MPPAGGAACVTRTLIRTRSGAIARVCEGLSDGIYSAKPTETKARMSCSAVCQ